MNFTQLGKPENLKEPFKSDGHGPVTVTVVWVDDDDPSHDDGRCRHGGSAALLQGSPRD